MQNPAYIQQLVYPETDGEPMAETDLHAKLMIDLWFALNNFFRDDPQVYVTRNLFLYYVKGDPKKRVAPDVFFVRGVPKGDRRVYFLWEEGVVPQVVVELSSQSTWREDVFKKFHTYQSLGVEEYYIFDPTSDYMKDQPLLGFRLEDGQYVEMDVKDGRLRSQALGLDLVHTGETLGLVNPATGEMLLTPEEESMARVRVETENEQLRAELARLRQQA
ncbi:MAG: Uma2 family endonuclease [Blastocatellia bacterium]